MSKHRGDSKPASFYVEWTKDGVTWKQWIAGPGPEAVTFRAAWYVYQDTLTHLVLNATARWRVELWGRNGDRESSELVLGQASVQRPYLEQTLVHLCDGEHCRSCQKPLPRKMGVS